MPIYSTYYRYCPETARRLRAWCAHYEAKGCNTCKARALAEKKRYKSTWPP